MRFSDLDPDQRRETINTHQRFGALREAQIRRRSNRGSMTWSMTNGREYLLRSAYDKNGTRRQKSLGPRSAETEALKTKFETARAKTERQVKDLEAVMSRQASINRALRLGRMPVEAARILRELDAAGLLGGKLRVVGSHALYAYEAVAGVHFETAYMETGDFDFLLDSRAGVSLSHSGGMDGSSLLRLLQRVDRSFEQADQSFRAVNRAGFLVDLITPLRDPPWSQGVDRLGSDPEDLAAVEIEGLAWHASAASFEAVVIDARGAPVRIVATDPRVFAAHKLWLSERADRERIKRIRDKSQALAVGALVATHLTHLPFEASELRMLPKPIFDAAASLFVPINEDDM